MKIILDEFDEKIEKIISGEIEPEEGFVPFDLFGESTTKLTLGITVTNNAKAQMALSRFMYSKETREMVKDKLGFQLDAIDLTPYKSKEDFKREIINLIQNM